MGGWGGVTHSTFKVPQLTSLRNHSGVLLGHLTIISSPWSVPLDSLRPFQGKVWCCDTGKGGVAEIYVLKFIALPKVKKGEKENFLILLKKKKNS